MPKPPRVLIVDDDRTVREALASSLEEAGYDACPAEGVGAARLRLGEGGVDAVLLDIRLKDGDGLALLEELRREAPHLPVIMATAYGDSDRTIQAMHAGAFEYMTKPFDLDALLASVARAVRTPPAARVEVQSEATTFVGSEPGDARGVEGDRPRLGQPRAGPHHGRAAPARSSWRAPSTITARAAAGRSSR